MDEKGPASGTFPCCNNEEQTNVALIVHLQMLSCEDWCPEHRHSDVDVLGTVIVGNVYMKAAAAFKATPEQTGDKSGCLQPRHTIQNPFDLLRRFSGREYVSN